MFLFQKTTIAAFKQRSCKLGKIWKILRYIEKKQYPNNTEIKDSILHQTFAIIKKPKLSQRSED